MVAIENVIDVVFRDGGLVVQVMAPGTLDLAAVKATLSALNVKVHGIARDDRHLVPAKG